MPTFVAIMRTLRVGVRVYVRMNTFNKRYINFFNSLILLTKNKSL